MSGARAFRVWVRVLDKRRRLSAASESTAVTVIVDIAVEPRPQPVRIAVMVPVKRLVVTALAVAATRIGRPIESVGVESEISRVNSSVDG